MARLLRRWFVFFVFVHRNRIQVFGLKNLAAVEATDVLCSVASIQEFGPIVLASLHNEVKPILDCTIRLSSVKLGMRFSNLHRIQSSQMHIWRTKAAAGTRIQ